MDRANYLVSTTVDFFHTLVRSPLDWCMNPNRCLAIRIKWTPILNHHRFLAVPLHSSAQNSMTTTLNAFKVEGSRSFKTFASPCRAELMVMAARVGSGWKMKKGGELYWQFNNYIKKLNITRCIFSIFIDLFQYSTVECVNSLAGPTPPGKRSRVGNRFDRGAHSLLPKTRMGTEQKDQQALLDGKIGGRKIR